MATSTIASHHGASAPQKHAHVHVVPLSLLTGVFIALLFLTGLTVAVTYIDLGDANIWLALGIATLKAFLVALYFMHLRYDGIQIGLILFGAVLFLGLFIVLTMADTQEYEPSMVPLQDRISEGG